MEQAFNFTVVFNEVYVKTNYFTKAAINELQKDQLGCCMLDL